MRLGFRRHAAGTPAGIAGGVRHVHEQRAFAPPGVLQMEGVWPVLDDGALLQHIDGFLRVPVHAVARHEAEVAQHQVCAGGQHREGSQDEERCEQGAQQLFQPALVTLLHRFIRQAQRLGDLPRRLALVIFHAQNRLVHRVERLQSAAQGVVVLQAGERAAGRARVGAPLLPPLVLSDAVQRHMARDGRQIRLERPFFRVEPLPGPVKFRERFVHAVLHILVVGQAGAAHRPEQAAVGLDQRGHARFRVLLQQLEQSLIRRHPANAPFPSIPSISTLSRKRQTGTREKIFLGFCAQKGKMGEKRNIFAALSRKRQAKINFAMRVPEQKDRNRGNDGSGEPGRRTKTGKLFLRQGCRKGKRGQGGKIFCGGGRFLV